MDLPVASARVNEGAALPIRSSGLAGFDAGPLLSLAATVAVFAPREQAVDETIAASEAPNIAADKILDTGIPLFKLYRDSPPRKRAAKPVRTAAAMPESKRKLGMTPNARMQPGRRIAEALAGVVPPFLSIAAGRAWLHLDSGFSELRGPAQFSSGVLPDFFPQQELEGSTGRVAQTHPGEVKNLVCQDPGEFQRAALQVAIEND